MSTIIGYVVTMMNKLDGSVMTKGLVSYEEVVAETCNYISSQSESYSPRKSYVGVTTFATSWGLKVAEVSDYLRTQFIMNCYPHFDHKVTVKLNLYPINEERDRTIANKITIKAIMGDPLPNVEELVDEEPPTWDDDDENEEKSREAAEKAEDRYERFLERCRRRHE